MACCRFRRTAGRWRRWRRWIILEILKQCADGDGVAEYSHAMQRKLCDGRPSEWKRELQHGERHPDVGDGAADGGSELWIVLVRSTRHCPKVIDNNGQPVQLGLLNVFNTDANTLEEYNGANPQTLTVYGSRTDASDYERMRLGFDD